MACDGLRLDHLYVSVRDLATSERFYDPVMRALGTDGFGTGSSSNT